jgi:hypothetical protein
MNAAYRRLFLILAAPAVLALATAHGQLKEEPSPQVTAQVNRDKAMIELGILKREYEELRVARIHLLTEMENYRCEMRARKDKSLQQREMGEKLDVMKDQLDSLEKMIDEARGKLDAALLANAQSAAAAPASPTP